MNMMVGMSFITDQMDDAIAQMQIISANNAEVMEKFLLQDEELCTVKPCGAGFLVEPSEALKNFIEQNKEHMH